MGQMEFIRVNSVFRVFRRVMVDLRPEGAVWIAVGILPILIFPIFPLIWLPWAAYVAYFVWSQFVNVRFISSYKRAVYITGCDSGFGHELAVSLDQHGFHVFAGCLHADGPGAGFLKAQASDRLMVLPLDVTSDESVDYCAKVITDKCSADGLKLWALYNNAGIATAGEVEWCPISLYQHSLDVNLLGVIRTTKSVMPLIRQSKGRIVTITSGIARVPMPGRSTYCLTKAAVESFMESLQYEMSKFGINCAVVNPGNHTGATKIFANMQRSIDKVFADMKEDVKKYYGQDYLSAYRHNVLKSYKIAGPGTSYVLEAIEHAIRSERPRYRYKPMPFSWLLWNFIMQYLPDHLGTWVVWFWLTRRLPKPAYLKNR